MKKLWILAMILLAVGCSKTEDGGIIPESTLSTVLYGVIEDGNEDEEDETRVYLDNKIRIRWNKSDLITVFNGTTRNQKYEYLGRDGSTGGEFDVVPSESLGAGNAVEHIYALYPYDRFTEYCYAEDDSESDYIVYTVPAEQTYKTNSIGLNSNLMVAVTPKDGDGTLVFRNVCSYLRLKFYGKDQEVRSIVLKGNAGEVLSGDAAITPVYGGIPTIKMLAEAGDDNQTITLNCPESVTVGSTKEEATEFWMVVPPFNFSQGFTITVYGDDNKSQEYIFNNNLTFERNTYNTITRELTSYNIHIPGNQIWYTSTDGKIVEPSNAKAFGANVVSNVYEDGKGVITFDKVVTGIGYGAFSEIQNFKSVTISDDVKTVNDLAIYYCHNLEAFYGKFSSDDNRCLIVDGKLTAFAPSDLVSYDIPETVTEIGNAVFKGISGLEQINIPNTVTTIHGQAFHACWDLKSVTIPESVVDIREGAFTYCRRLTAFYGKYASSDNKALIVDDVFIAFARGCSDTIYTIPDGVTAIGSGAFYGNSDIVEVVFPNSLTRIVRGAFSGCSSMKNVTIPENVTTIEENAFCGIGLESVICKPTTPPAGAEEMFKEMNSSAKIYVPAESVEAYKAADYWKDYADIIEPYNPEDDITTIPNNQIWYTATEKVEPYKTDVFGANIVSNEWEEETGKGVITFDGDVTGIGQSAFYGCSSLTSVNIPNSVTWIGPSVFYNCDSLTSVTIPGSVTGIGQSAFEGCSSLTSITLPEGVTTIRLRAFYGCSSLTSITIPDGVTTIEGFAFYDCRSLTSVTIPMSVTTIGLKAFDGCDSLFNDDDNIEYVGDVLVGVKDETLTSYRIKEGTRIIGNDAFAGCSNLTSITIPDSVTSIGESAFSECKSLTNIVIPEGITAILMDTFYGCEALKSVTIPDSVKSIGYYAFQYCRALQTLIIGNGVKSIANYAFDWCESLQSVTIPDSVTSIGMGAFRNCTSLKDVYCMAVTPPTLGNEYVFYNNAFGRQFYVQIVSLEAYNTAAIWSDYKIIADYTPIECTSLTIEADDVAGYMTSTNIRYSAITNGLSFNRYNVNNITITGETVSNQFEVNTSLTESIERTITFSYLGKSATTTITQGPSLAKAYIVDLNDQWQNSSVPNPDPTLYDGVYESFSNYHWNRHEANMYIDIVGYENFTIYVRCDSEASFDYLTVFFDNKAVMDTEDNGSSDTSFSGYTEVKFSNIDAGPHRITIRYDKDESDHSGADRGYVFIPKNQ